MKSFLTFLILMLVSYASHAQIGFQERIIIGPSFGTNQLQSINSADIDGDGDLDLLSASLADDKIAWYENIDGLGTFGAQRIISVNSDSARSVNFGDIDRDGDVDVVSASYTDNKIAWYENLDGLGAFGPERIISNNANGAFHVEVVDINNDQNLDIVYASRIGGSVIAWHENIGEGNFASQQIITTAIASVVSFVVADIDGDGDSDVVSASQGDNKIVWFENSDGLGNFGSQQIITSTLSYAQYVWASDLDNDGDLDLIASSDGLNTTDYVVWYKNIDGNGTFVLQSTVLASTNGIQRVNAMDVDDDGDLDILSSNTVNKEILWFENTDGMGSFGSQQPLIEEAVNGSLIHLMDFDNDSDMDIVSSSFSNQIVTFKNVNNVMNFELNQFVTSIVNRPGVIFAADLDNDGDLDIISGSTSDSKIAWHENIDGLGTFSRQQIITDVAYGGFTLYASDLDLDGDLDIISNINTIGSMEIIWYENMDGQGTFSQKQTIAPTNNAATSAIMMADLDNDDIDDIVYASGTTSRIGWIKNYGDGTFGNITLIPGIIYQVNSIKTADINMDGNIDIVSSQSLDGIIGWHRNIDGTGSFSGRQVIYSNNTESYSVDASDMDGDGDLDVLSTIDYFRVAWHKNNNGLGNFASPQTVSSDIPSPGKAISVDLDNDGDEDVVSISLIGNLVCWYENNDGLGNFNGQQIISNDTDEPISVFIADLNADGKKDIVVASRNDNTIRWFENLGTLSIAESDLILFSISPNPSDGIVTIKTNSTIKNIELYNELGQIILTLTPENGVIDISTITDGLYFLKISDVNQHSETKKIIKK